MLSLPKVISEDMLAEKRNEIPFRFELLVGTAKGNFMFWPRVFEVPSTVFAYTFGKSEAKG